MALDAAFFADPYGACAGLRARGPVHRVRAPDGSHAWLVVDHRTVLSALQDGRMSTNSTNSNGSDYRGLPLPPALRNDLLHLDPPRHSRLRRLVAYAFTTRSTSRLRPWTELEVGRLLRAVDPGEPVDFRTAVALPLPLTIICDVLGVPHEERGGIDAWTGTLLVPQDQEVVAGAMADAEAQLRSVVRHKRAHPGDDLVTALLQHRDREADPTEDEVISLCFVLLAAGHDTTTSFLCNALVALLEPRTHWVHLRRTPALLPSAVEELLRFDGPLAMAIRRFPTSDITLAGVDIAAGETVLLSLAAANRDPHAFPDPDVIDLAGRSDAHLSFGAGVHVCPGSSLARMQAQVVLETLLRDFPDVELAEPADSLPRRPSHRTRSLERLPVILSGCGRSSDAG